MSDDFKIGDIVELKSGHSPEMVVTEDNMAWVVCGWFNASADWHDQAFDARLLRNITREQAEPVFSDVPEIQGREVEGYRARKAAEAKAEERAREDEIRFAATEGVRG